jgi:hypothetical protein
MVKNIGLEMRQTHRSAVGNKVNFMPFPGQTKPQLRGYNPRTTIGWITNDSYFHVFLA